MVHTSLKKWAMSAAGTDRNRSLDGSRRKKRINHDAHAIMEIGSRRRRSWGRRPERLGFDSGELARIRQDTDAHQHNGSRSRDVCTDAGQHPKRPSRKVVCAWGKHAAYLTENHDLSNIFGDGSPIGKLYELNGKVLLLGTGYGKNTSLRLADARARYPGKHTCTEHSAVLENGKRVWKAYETLFVDGEDFEKAYSIPTVQLGNAAIRLMNQRDVVDFAVQWIEEKPAVKRRPQVFQPHDTLCSSPVTR